MTTNSRKDSQHHCCCGPPDRRAPELPIGALAASRAARLADVRKQYHFWPGESGLDAWDVDRLVALSRALPVTAVDVSTIAEVDTVY